jgi:hypothetical protein
LNKVLDDYIMESEEGYKNLFIKKRDEIVKLDGSMIRDTIPKDSYKTPQVELRKNKIEWRWRFLKINGKEYVEMSSLLPNKSDRTYANQFGKWKEKNIDPEFDQYVTEIFYYYA